MTSGTKILIAMAAVTAVGAAIGRVVAYFHLPQTFASSAIGVVIGMGIALGAFSLMPKQRSAGSLRKSSKDQKLELEATEGSSPWHY